MPRTVMFDLGAVDEAVDRGVMVEHSTPIDLVLLDHGLSVLDHHLLSQSEHGVYDKKAGERSAAHIHRGECSLSKEMRVRRTAVTSISPIRRKSMAYRGPQRQHGPAAGGMRVRISRLRSILIK